MQWMNRTWALCKPLLTVLTTWQNLDIADRALFAISQNGELTFEDSPSFEAESTSGDDSYQVVVQASDGGVETHVNWFKVTVNVTDVEESGTVAEWTIDPDGPVVNGGGTEPADQSLLQFNASAVLTVVNPTDNDGDVANVQWQWYRSRTASMTGGTAINNANSRHVHSVGQPGKAQRP